jgi:peptide/nickel transport system permease protein
MRTAEFVLVLPAIYVVLALRAALPLVVPPTTVFVMMTGILALVGWPHVARGVRGIVAAEARREYAIAAASLGASRARLLFRHLHPASFGFVAVQTTLLVPAFILAEATLSYVALGFPDQVPSWGTMLREAASVATLVDFPWALAPAAAIVLVALACNLILQAGSPARQPRWGAEGGDRRSFGGGRLI